MRSNSVVVIKHNLYKGKTVVEVKCTLEQKCDLLEVNKQRKKKNCHLENFQFFFAVQKYSFNVSLSTD